MCCCKTLACLLLKQCLCLCGCVQCEFVYVVAAIVTSIPNGHTLADSVPPMRPIYPRTQYGTQYTSAQRVPSNEFSPPCSGSYQGTLLSNFGRTATCTGNVLVHYVHERLVGLGSQLNERIILSFVAERAHIILTQSRNQHEYCFLRLNLYDTI